MKKLLVLMLVLSMVTVASATISWDLRKADGTTSITAGGLSVGMTYQLQLIFYEPEHDRLVDMSVEGSIIAKEYNVLHDDKYVDEFKVFGYVNEDCQITEKGQKFIESDEVILRLKDMLK